MEFIAVCKCLLTTILHYKIAASSKLTVRWGNPLKRNTLQHLVLIATIYIPEKYENPSTHFTPRGSVCGFLRSNTNP